MQSYLFEQGYSKVAVFCVGGRCRNNVGAWPVENVLVESGLKGRSPYTRRDEAMAEEADFGLVLWDGNSEGSFNNVLELLKRNKKVVVYFAPRQQFVNIKTREDVRKLLQFCESGAFHGFQRSLHLRRQMASLLIGAQTPLHLPD